MWLYYLSLPQICPSTSAFSDWGGVLALQREMSATIAIYWHDIGYLEPSSPPAISPEDTPSATGAGTSTSCSVLEMKTFWGDLLMRGLRALKVFFVALAAARGVCTGTICWLVACKAVLACG